MIEYLTCVDDAVNSIEDSLRLLCFATFDGDCDALPGESLNCGVDQICIVDYLLLYINTILIFCGQLIRTAIDWLRGYT